jgi:hypothetical protein
MSGTNPALIRQACASWVSEGEYVFAARLQEVGSRYWLRARAMAVVTHDRALRKFDELTAEAASKGGGKP